ncbi:HPF/RaiA family ribosome-associated protein [Vulgatibacter incomptus]|uniref:Ribosomal subunit interface protein n=1 Tax=Vulgatibacter incomptus TaxID=1391653 RepID=A0A0K1P9R6_9BACT|nr:HPF/RaiA family ribosome-associated protein [Vulgatibacter incomptus]AKU90176.1 Ribosomal subunit interface protein [Vulgatibacter incomptus]
MQFVVHGHHLELTDALKERCRQHVLERAGKLVVDSAARLEIVLADEYGSRHGRADKACSLDFRAPGIPPIHVTEVRPNMYEAIDLAADRLVEALRRGVEKRENFNRRESIKNLAVAMPLEAEPLDDVH